MDDIANILKDNIAIAIGAIALLGAIGWWLFAASGGPVMDKQVARAFPLVEKTVLTENTRLFRFSVGAGKKLGLPVGRHVRLIAPAGPSKAEIFRSYTPVSTADIVGHFDLLIKIYPTPGGAMGRYLDSLEIGQTIDVKGPFGLFDYQVGKFKELGMLAGGTGITPMYQVISAILDNPKDTTRVRLIFANVKETDILMKSRLEELAKSFPEQFSVYFVLNEPPPGWEGGSGFISEAHIKEHVGLPETDKQVLLCGPQPMNRAMRVNLTNLGYEKSDIFAF
ncbi:hypothetical protein NDN08_007723 [Rhodosorus marinus]|uniref:NADH-cytochrome b5 reductase n=1 Tax=Rhodosorus marinus TaxID=101924 RepID=A0AAV8V2H5_9RHOD|nr:hypothetical protein NDN08_007723 [Rhodosorus marinus]